MTLFGSGTFVLHSGRTSGWKIDCDSLTEADWDTLAHIAKYLTGPYSEAVSPGGAGHRFAKALNRLKERGPLLIADDVFTTGASMEKLLAEHRHLTPEGYRGVVVFARGPLPHWIQAIFQIDAKLWGL